MIHGHALVFHYDKQNHLSAGHNSTTSVWTVSPYTQHIDKQISPNCFTSSGK